ncbi:unannotated protein [freshwater metagenome]|uniref:Unannotated protein n=1 Tax=freshwater metagenome TaxID=449393 RepID=A0A6J6L9P1_9ZZZZ|nr:DUF1638 domain-containing protein [Actinomycetota bacterium]MSY37187.1 DUF1638 domain-containing protein [Actinomycetota bacterium]MTB08329.1 DUF1638 domain-containing protein [Actinomycetota bacterium]
MSIGIVACGALATHIGDIVNENELDVVIYPLPPLLHNRPEKIAGEVDALLCEIKDKHSTCAVAYADCGTYGALDAVIEHHNVKRLRGNHCYDIFAGATEIERIMAEDAGTYFLTDFLVKSFHRSVIVELGLDKYPHLRDDYFKNYTRVIWLAQIRTPELEKAAIDAAAEIGLPLQIQSAGYAGLTHQVMELISH